MSRLRFAWASAALLAGAAIAQPASDVPQIPDQSKSVATDEATPALTTEAPQQISSRNDDSTAQTQLTNARASRQEASQLSSGVRTVQAAPPLSRPSDGRTAAIDRVEGKDRCDAAIPANKQTEDCKKVLETRADDYARPAPQELSPEQRLLLDQQLQGAGEPLADATHRLATSGVPDNSTDSMGIAAIVLKQSEPQPSDKDKKQDPATEAAVQAIVQFVTQTPPQ